MKVKRVGRYVMHDVPFVVYIDPKVCGAQTNHAWSEGPFITILLGMESSWSEMVRNLLHELVEMSMGCEKCSFAPQNTGLCSGRTDTGRFVFHMTHDQFSEVCDHVGDAITYLLPDLAKSWKAAKKG